jgi:hypothetical protein
VTANVGASTYPAMRRSVLVFLTFMAVAGALAAWWLP